MGVELAGEIAERYSAKLVSIIHKRSYLVSPSYGDQFQRKVKNVLKDRSVQALLGNFKEAFYSIAVSSLTCKLFFCIINFNNNTMFLDETVTNFHELTVGKFLKQTVKTSKVNRLNYDGYHMYTCQTQF